jgi:HK97 gp10 family phage protein
MAGERVELKLTGLDGVLDLLKSLPPEVVSKRGGPVKSALRKGAQVIRKAELRHLERSLANAPQYSTGHLEKQLVVKRGKQPTGTNGERYIVTVRRKAYPGRSASGAATALKTAQLLEYGSEKQRPEPWIRPAFAESARAAISTVETELLKALDRVVKKLAKK